MPGQWTRRLGSCSSQARALSTAQRQSSANVKHVTPLKGSELGPTLQHGHGTFRARKDGKKPLPLPPLLDPVVLEQRSRHEQMKQQPKFADFTPFQRKLWENPFAHVLASPVRECRATQAVFPSALLSTLNARPHPTTGDPWLLPVSLTTTTAPLSSPLYFLTRQLIVSQLGKGGKKAWLRALNARTMEKFPPGELDKTVWREDMPELMLELLRTRVVDRLSWSFSWRGRLIPVASPRSEDIEAVEDVSTVLMYGSLRTRGDDIQERADAITAELEKWATYFGSSFGRHFDPHASPEVTHKAPPWYTQPLVPHMQPRLQFPELEFKTTMWRGRKVAVYSLTDMLGSEKTRQLIGGPNSKYADQKCVVIKRARHNVPVETLLMQLQAYIARPGI